MHLRNRFEDNPKIGKIATAFTNHIIGKDQLGFAFQPFNICISYFRQFDDYMNNYNRECEVYSTTLVEITLVEKHILQS